MALNASTHMPHSTQQVIDTLTDRGFAEHLSTLAKGQLSDFSVTGDVTGAFTLVAVRSLPTDRVPDMAKKFVGSAVEVTQTEKWSAPDAAGNRTANVEITVGGVPVSVSGTETLSSTAEGCTFAVDAKVSSSIPFIGPKIASAAEPYLGKALKLQADQVNAWRSR